MHNTITLALFSTAIFCTLYSAHSMVLENWICKPCQSEKECDQDPPQYCIWGEARDACNRRICAKGPGERCGGSLNVLGVCGEGMMCKSDEKCHGCSIQTLECYN